MCDIRCNNCCDLPGEGLYACLTYYLIHLIFIWDITIVVSNRRIPEILHWSCFGGLFDLDGAKQHNYIKQAFIISHECRAGFSHVKPRGIVYKCILTFSSDKIIHDNFIALLFIMLAKELAMRELMCVKTHITGLVADYGIRVFHINIEQNFVKTLSKIPICSITLNHHARYQHNRARKIR